MDWTVPYSLGISTKSIRKFLIEVASLEAEIAFSGLYVARKLDDFSGVTALMDEFPQTFSSFKRNIASIDRETFSTLDLLEKDSLLVEQISLINLKLQMSRPPTTASLIKSFAKSLTYFTSFTNAETKRIFGEESISIERTIINCDRLISALNTAEEIIRHRNIRDNEIFKPSRVKESVVVDLIDQASDQLDNSTSLNPETKQLINEYLAEIKAEAQSKAPRWQNIIGSLMIVAAITSGLSDAPGAAKTLESLIQYIVGVAAIKPEAPFLPSPTDAERIGVDFFNGVDT